VIDLERALTDVAERLDLPASDHAADDLRRRLLASPVDARLRRVRVLIAVAAALALVSAGVVTIAPARHAVANWFGIGAVEIRRTDRPRPTSPSTTAHADATGPAARLAEARRVVRFTIVTPPLATAGPLTDVDLDRRVPGGLVVLAYARFTLVELAADATQPSPLAKLVGTATSIEHVSVHGAEGLWVGGVHEIGFIDRDGHFRKNTVRRSGPVLLWARRGVTYRIEGLRTRAAALRIATSVR
jgi:hypothetical protein